jgi:aminoglycoside phosphotransferase (APT) family kinase protein
MRMAREGTSATCEDRAVATSRQRLRGGGRFTVTVDVARARVVKRGPAPDLRREARALRMVAGRDVAPALVTAGPGRLETALVAGAPRPARALTVADGRALGALLRAVHESHRRRTGGRHVWPARVRSLAAYRRMRIADVRAVAGRDRRLAERVIAALPPEALADEPVPFALLHGDPVLANVVWDGRPVLVDWEFWRFGDAAEDLAYVIEVNMLPARVAAALVDGYGPGGAVARVGTWRALVALDAGLWYRRAGEPERARRLLERAAALTGLSPRSGARAGR